MRTSGRPKFFTAAVDSVFSQDYDNIKLVVHSDNVSDDYVFGDMLIRSEKEKNNQSENLVK